MAYKVYSERYFSAWGPYVGPYEQGVWKFYGPLEQAMPVSWASKLASIYIEQFRMGGKTLLYMKIEADISGPLETNYRVTTYSHDSTAGVALEVGVAPLVVGLIAAAVVVIGLVLLSILWYPAIKRTADVIGQIPNMVLWVVGGTVFLGALYLLLKSRQGGNRRLKSG